MTAVVGDGPRPRVRVRYSWECRASSAAPAARARRCRSSARIRFSSINGDTITDVDLSKLADAHGRSGALVTLALVPNRDSIAMAVCCSTPGRVTGFVPRGPAANGRVTTLASRWCTVGFSTVRRRRSSELDRRRVRPTVERSAPGSVRGYSWRRRLLGCRYSGRLLADVDRVGDS